MNVSVVASAQEPSLATVLARTGAYVTEFERQLSSIVTEERYVQEAHPAPRLDCVPGGSDPCRTWTPGATRLSLRSDLLLVRPEGAQEWVQFRDVFEADGVPVRDRRERLTRLFLDTTASGRAHVRQILEESARFNIGNVERNINAPVLALRFLEPANQARFSFARTNDRALETFTRRDTPTAAFRATSEVWIVQYREKQEGTFIRNRQHKDVPARGRFWIEPATGRVLMSELLTRDRAVRATIDVSYQSEPLVGLLVPIEMREDYQGPAGSHITGIATYGRFRQFQVKVDEKFARPR